MNKAADFARRGQLIFAIKHLEVMNPDITRAQAKAAVESLGYSGSSSNRSQKTPLERVL